MTNRRTYNWKCRNLTLKLGDRTLVMGILNATPDSFSDGGDFYDINAAVDRALDMEAQGADIIDIGGESTRPGATPVPALEEIKRTLPVIEKIREHSSVPISIDTMKAETAFQALEAGANIINDISAFETDPKMVEVAAQTAAGAVLMHMKGTPQTMQDDPAYANVVQDVRSYLQQRMDFAASHGVGREHLVVDPGIGFGKTLEHNLDVMRRLPDLAECGRPLLVGASRKSFIGQLLGRDNPAERLSGSLGAAAWAVLQGAHILRVHDVIETCDVCRMLDTFVCGEP
ncbi:dihydropteroate synthase [Pontiella sulfatireligans]|uniref:Dihydropteroate synthase n=1 Tax=Pontiella sulfatireligans TaxID=2750658 RepID=A0A6C2UPF6_9BACT|nr:dihydropteroate synthase [Pontiella sulfatireligans]VGO22155.1 Dihydropteroate synthase [Pontiella sulfatireligans]